MLLKGLVRHVAHSRATSRLGAPGARDVLLAEWLGETFGRWADSLPEDQHHALVEYKGDGCRALNAALRRDPLSDAQGSRVARLDRALERFTLPEPVIVYRGFQLPGAAIVGARIEDRAYFSTSLLAQHAEGFPKSARRAAVLTRVLLGAGTACGAPDLIEYLGEVEILLPRQCTLVIRAASAPSKTQPRFSRD